ncbi:MAG TPA: type II secretion system protein GspL [Nitrospiria bacterium]|nr:type II secretion system protein GspL [Nitrospiria bacterium]
MPRRTVGVEMGAEAIRLVRVVGGLRQSKVEGWQVRPLPPPDRVDHRSAVVQALRELAAAGWFNADQIVLSLPGDQATSRVVTVPFQDPQKVGQVLPFEIESLLPFDLDQVLISPAAVQRTPTGSRVLAVVLPKSRMTALLEMTAEAGIDPTVVEIGPSSLARLARAVVPPAGRLADGSSEALLTVMELGDATTTLAVCRGGRLLSARTLSGRAGLSPESDQALLAEVKRAVHFSALEERAEATALLVCGARADEADASGLTERLSAELNAQRIEEVPAWLSPPDAQGGWPAARPFAQAIGAALRSPEESFNFRQAEFVSPSEQSRARTRSVGVVAAVLVLLLLAGADLFTRYYVRERAYEAVKAEQRALFTRSFTDVRGVVNELEQARDAMKTLNRRASFLGEGEPSALLVLDRLTKALQALPELRVDRMSIAGADVRFEGEVNSFEAVDRVKELLRGVESATQATISDARMSVDQQHVRFRAELSFAPPAEPAGRTG